MHVIDVIKSYCLPMITRQYMYLVCSSFDRRLTVLPFHFVRVKYPKPGI